MRTSENWLPANLAMRPKLSMGCLLARRIDSNSSPTFFMPTKATIEGVFHAHLEQLLGAADAAGAECAAAVVEHAEGDFEAFTELAEDALFGHAHVVEAESRLPCAADAHFAAVGRDDLKTGQIRGD